jgi:transcriptional regulator with XRE-family HTH domain
LPVGKYNSDMNRLDRLDRIHQSRQHRKVAPSDEAEVARLVTTEELAQQEIADRVGVSQSYVRRVSKSAHRIFDWMQKLGLSEDDLEGELESWELFHRIMTLIAIDDLVRSRGYTVLDDEALATQVAFDRRASR